MLTPERLLTTCAKTFALALALLAVTGCATPDVGAVVVAPKVQVPPVPQVVEQTLPMEPGYFLRGLKACCSIGLKKPTN